MNPRATQPTSPKGGTLPQVQIHLWQDALTPYSGGVFLRKMVFHEGKEPNALTVSSKVNELLGSEHENSLAVLIESIKGQNISSTPESLFCSDLVAQVLIELG